MRSQQGFAHLLLLLLLVLLALGGYFAISQGLIKLPGTPFSKEPTVELKEEYKNPFDKRSQYVNPFDQYKSPFLNLKK